MRSLNHSYLPRVDYIRGGAAWWVAFHHATAYFPLAGALPTYWVGSNNPVAIVSSQGWLAVGLFLMISGFSLGRGLKNKSVAWLGYLQSRFLRVAPLYLLLLFVGTLAVRNAPSAPDFIASLTMLPIPTAYSPSPWMGQTWSVRIEVLLYFTIPALVVLFSSSVPRKLIVPGASLFVLLVALAYLNGAPSEEIVYFGVIGRLFEFSFGFALGFYGVKVGRQVRRIFGWIALIGFGVLAFWLNRTAGFPELPTSARFLAYGAGIVLSSALLLWANTSKPWSWSPFDRAGQAFGSWSYSIYMWHVVLITLIIVPIWKLLGAAGVGVNTSLLIGLLGFVALTTIVSWASYTVVEKPFLSLRPRYVQDVANKDSLAS